ncbi:hypothetical protein JZ785_19920 [Alicyclobacillus curvatus]|nr:hypothetical protein JZ785_19920 [Alicyclobacillus curvatus]
MKKYKKWATGGVAVSIIGILAGCGNANNTTGGTAPAPTNTSNQTVTNTATNTVTNSTANPTTNSVSNTTTDTNTTPAVDTQTPGNQTGTWKTYTNGRFGFTVEYPSTWQMGPHPNDSDGRWFTTPSGVKSFDNGYGSGVAKSDVMLLGVGTVNAVIGSGMGYDFKQMVAAFKKNLPNERKQQGFVSESYSVVPNKWIVDTLVTKVGHGGVQYSVTYTSLGTNQTITMTFPESKSDVYLPIWNYVSKKFQPGNKPG